MGIRTRHRVVLWMLGLVLPCSCQLFFGEDEKLSLERRPLQGNTLRLQGYYYHKYADGAMANAYFLYQDGTALCMGAFPTNQWKAYEGKYADVEIAEKVRNMKFNWGVVQIEGDTIKLERWYPSERPYRTATRVGRILNDSTFVFDKVILSNGKEILKNERYHFKPFASKMDSLCRFLN